MKAILEFNLPEEREDHLRAIKSLDMAICLHEWGEYMRLMYRGKIEDQTLGQMMDKWRDTLDGNNINIEEILS